MPAAAERCDAAVRRSRSRCKGPQTPSPAFAPPASTTVTARATCSRVQATRTIAKPPTKPKAADASAEAREGAESVPKDKKKQQAAQLRKAGEARSTARQEGRQEERQDARRSDTMSSPGDPLACGRLAAGRCRDARARGASARAAPALAEAAATAALGARSPRGADEPPARSRRPQRRRHDRRDGDQPRRRRSGHAAENRSRSPTRFPKRPEESTTVEATGTAARRTRQKVAGDLHGADRSNRSRAHSRATLAPYEQIEILIQVKSETRRPPEPEHEVSVRPAGRCRQAATASCQPLRVSSEADAFGVESLRTHPGKRRIQARHQAGSHPFQLTTTFNLNETLEPIRRRSQLTRGRGSALCRGT